MKKKNPIITIEKCGLAFSLHGKKSALRVLNDVSVTINRGEFFVFLGPSGSGKSTLLRIMCGLEKGYTGKVSLAEDVLSEDTSFVFQQFALYPWLTIYENVALGLIARGEKEAVMRRRVQSILSELELGKFAHAYPHELSGGMRQRVGIARALATDPKIIFMDEPFSGLDSFTASELRKVILRVWEEHAVTIVLVTHLVSEALELADRIGVLTPRPATIEKIVTNELPRPRQHRTEAFFAMEDKITELVRP